MQRAHGQNRELTHANREDTHTSIEHIRQKGDIHSHNKRTQMQQGLTLRR